MLGQESEGAKKARRGNEEQLNKNDNEVKDQLRSIANEQDMVRVMTNQEDVLNRSLQEKIGDVAWDRPDSPSTDQVEPLNEVSQREAIKIHSCEVGGYVA